MLKSLFFLSSCSCAFSLASFLFRRLEFFESKRHREIPSSRHLFLSVLTLTFSSSAASTCFRWERATMSAQFKSARLTSARWVAYFFCVGGEAKAIDKDESAQQGFWIRVTDTGGPSRAVATYLSVHSCAAVPPLAARGHLRFKRRGRETGLSLYLGEREGFRRLGFACKDTFYGRYQYQYQDPLPSVYHTDIKGQEYPPWKNRPP